MLEAQLLMNLAVVLIIASLVALIFHRLRQPIVVGYILSGIIVGPYTPPFSLISQPEILGALAELGVILLLFGIGLHFPFRKLREAGHYSDLVAYIMVVSEHTNVAVKAAIDHATLHRGMEGGWRWRKIQ
jgi:Kef-type K+ transport system membrane component KefB